MKNLGIVCAALVVVASMVSTVSAADAISKSTLASMGLGSMQVMSDNDGLAVRGLGYRGTYATVWGESTANYQGQTSTNGYEAGAKHKYGPSSAEGKNLSVAGTVKLKYSSEYGIYLKANLGVAGGFSSASAH